MIRGQEGGRPTPPAVRSEDPPEWAPNRAFEKSVSRKAGARGGT